jgi:hypothetical protein
MNRLRVTFAVGGLSFLTAVVAMAAALTTPAPQGVTIAGVTIAPDVAEIATSRKASDGWPSPKSPFDETDITPVESAGAPMFP